MHDTPRDRSGGIMNLLVDIGNTTIGVIFSKDGKFTESFRLASRKDKVSYEYYSLFKHLLKDYLHEDVKHICVSSVVPLLTNIVLENLTRIYPKAKSIVVKPGIKTGVMLKIDNIPELGADLVCDLVALKKKYGPSSIVIDLGTATKFLLLDKDGVFQGCSIAPGLSQSLKGLCLEASLLPEVDLSLPKNVIGKNTFEAIKSGSVLGHAYMILGMCSAYEKEIGYKLKKIVTGGNSYYIKDILLDNSFIIDENLVFDGLETICDKNK